MRQVSVSGIRSRVFGPYRGACLANVGPNQHVLHLDPRTPTFCRTYNPDPQRLQACKGRSDRSSSVQPQAPVSLTICALRSFQRVGVLVLACLAEGTSSLHLNMLRPRSLFRPILQKSRSTSCRNLLGLLLNALPQTPNC